MKKYIILAVIVGGGIAAIAGIIAGTSYLMAAATSPRSVADDLIDHIGKQPPPADKIRRLLSFDLRANIISRRGQLCAYNDDQAVTAEAKGMAECYRFGDYLTTAKSDDGQQAVVLYKGQINRHTIDNSPDVFTGCTFAFNLVFEDGWKVTSICSLPEQQQ